MARFYISASEAKAAEVVTVKSIHGAIGTGFLVDGTVYVLHGAFAVIATEPNGDPMQYERDGGAAYYAIIRAVTGRLKLRKGEIR